MWPEKPIYLRSSLGSFNLELAQGTTLKFYFSVEKEKVRKSKFWMLILTFVEVTLEKVVVGAFLLYILKRINNWTLI